MSRQLDMIGEQSRRSNGRREDRGRRRDSGTAPDRACSVGVMAYNEEANIGNAINSILGQQLSRYAIEEVIVVASGCEDRTAAIVAEMARRDPRVRLIEQQHREGKASAINLFIQAAQSALLLLVSADLIVEDGTLEALLRHFDDPAVGMVGGHPTPVNDENTFLGHAVHLQWRLHDRVARREPKLGEIVAFRNVVPSIPLETAVDEISIQALITQLGYRLVYEPEAVVYNRGPATIADFLRQRRRIYAGHLAVRDQQGYCASTMSSRVLVRSLWGAQSFATPRAVAWSIGTIGLEATARALGRFDVARGRSQHVWDISNTTKRQIAEGAHAHAPLTVAVFHIAGFRRHELELGVHATRHLTRRVSGDIKRALGSDTLVSIQQGGTIVALMRADRDAAEAAADDLLRRCEGKPLSLNGHGRTVRVTLSCGLIAFPQTGPPLTKAIPPVGILDAAPTTSIAS